MDIPQDKLLQQIKDWQKRRVISDDIADALTLDLHSNQTAPAFVQNRIIKIITILGGLLIGGGILLFIASNWSYMSRDIKVFLIFAGVILFHLLGIIGKIKMPTSALPNVFHLIGTITFAGGIFLLGQIFHLNGDYADAFFWIFVGSLPLAYIINSRPILTFGLLFGYAWLLRILFLDNVLQYYYPVVFVSLGACIYLAGEVQEQFSVPDNLSNAFKNIGAITVLVTLFITSFDEFYTTTNYYSRIREAGFNLKYIILAVITTAVFITSTYLQNKKGSPLYGAAGMAGLIIMSGILTALISFNTGSGAAVLLANIVMIGAIVLFFNEGVKGRDKGLINIALAATIILIIARYIDFIADFLPRSLAFTFGGVILLSVGYFLEKKRKQIYQKFGIT